MEFRDLLTNKFVTNATIIHHIKTKEIPDNHYKPISDLIIEFLEKQITHYKQASDYELVARLYNVLSACNLAKDITKGMESAFMEKIFLEKLVNLHVDNPKYKVQLALAYLNIASIQQNFNGEENLSFEFILQLIKKAKRYFGETDCQHGLRDFNTKLADIYLNRRQAIEKNFEKMLEITSPLGIELFKIFATQTIELDEDILELYEQIDKQERTPEDTETMNLCYKHISSIQEKLFNYENPAQTEELRKVEEFQKIFMQEREEANALMKNYLLALDNGTWEEGLGYITKHNKVLIKIYNTYKTQPHLNNSHTTNLLKERIKEGVKKQSALHELVANIKKQNNLQNNEIKSSADRETKINEKSINQDIEFLESLSLHSEAYRRENTPKKLSRTSPSNDFYTLSYQNSFNANIFKSATPMTNKEENNDEEEDYKNSKASSQLSNH